jgi:hypothetical protein
MAPMRATNVRMVLAAVLLLAAAGCGGMQRSTSAAAASALLSPGTGSPAAGVSLDEVWTLDLEQVRALLLGEQPYPSGWEASVDATIATLARVGRETRLPDVAGLEPVAATCALWRPLVGRTDWATGALAERQIFLAHLVAAAQVAPDDVRPAFDEARRIVAEGAAEQLQEEGDPAIVSRYPRAEVIAIGTWAVERCDLQLAAEEPPDSEGWTEQDFADSCGFDRQFVEGAQEAYRSGPGDGRYAEHPHLLEVTIGYGYPAWHRFVVDNLADPPTLEVEPIPGGFCDR